MILADFDQFLSEIRAEDLSATREAEEIRKRLPRWIADRQRLPEPEIKAEGPWE